MDNFLEKTMNDTRTKKRGPKKASKKKFKFKRICKLPSCAQPFGTNRHWQYFHDPECQTAWHKFLNMDSKELKVEVMALKEEVKKIKRKLGMKIKRRKQ